jgi:hypothetical protein
VTAGAWVLYALAIAFIIGLLRWPVWTVPLLAAGAVFVTLGIGSEWNFAVWEPFNNPILVDLVLKLGLANLVACTMGYIVGRLIAWIWRRFTRASSAVPPTGPGPRQ